jgi:D-alanyl-D-alanine carboxypeptidase/D-alanyl-D-alanine-endopeptidase (penicillin-binding protein 4)
MKRLYHLCIQQTFCIAVAIVSLLLCNAESRAEKTKTTKKKKVAASAAFIPSKTLTSIDEAERFYECASKIETAIDKSRYFSRSNIGIVIKSDDGRIVYQRNQNKLLKPASNLKLVTSAIALEKLGPDFRYETQLYLDGTVTNGTLNGNIIIVGTADPLLSGYFDGRINTIVAQWADTLQARGIKAITGDVVLDNSYFTNNEFGDEEDAPAPKPHNISFATVASFTNANASQLAKVTRTKIVKTKSGKKVKRVYGFKRGTRRKLVSVEPNVYTANAFIKELRSRNMISSEEMRKINYSLSIDRTKWKYFYTSVSPKLGDILKITNKLSDNFYADQLTRTLGAEFNGEGTLESGLDVEREFLKLNVGIAEKDVQLADGSGLSHDNFVTPATLIRLMDFMKREKNFDTYYESLSIPMMDGTLQGRINHELASNIRAKTGTISGVTSLSGYMTSRNGKNLTFSILCNGPYHKKSMRLEDEICKLLLEI